MPSQIEHRRSPVTRVFQSEHLTDQERARYQSWSETCQKTAFYAATAGFSTLLLSPFLPAKLAYGFCLPFVYGCTETILVSLNVSWLYSSSTVRALARTSEALMRFQVTQNAPLASRILSCWIGSDFRSYFFPGR